MEVVNPRAALLSNLEVLHLLRQLEAGHLASQKSALKIKKEGEQAGSQNPKNPAQDDQVSENLRTIEVEAIQYLTASYQPSLSLSEAGVEKLVKSLAPFGLTKAEKLQIVNLVPTEPVELYTIVEELEERLGDQMDTVLNIVRNSISTDGVPVELPTNFTPPPQPMQEERLFLEEDYPNWDYQEEQVFDNVGEGAGIEGDLEAEDD